MNFTQTQKKIVEDLRNRAVPFYEWVELPHMHLSDAMVLAKFGILSIKESSGKHFCSLNYAAADQLLPRLQYIDERVGGGYRA